MTEEKQRILIVDDEPRNQRIISETLEDLVDLKTASTGEEALELIETFNPDLILLDIMMPGIDGLEVCKRIRAHPELSLTKVIFVSGKAMLEQKLKGYEIGADDYLTKPFMPEELLAKTKVFLRLTRVEKELKELNRSLDQTVKERTEQLLKTEAKLINAAKLAALGEMASGVAHEINTPLSVIGLTAEQIQELIEDGFVNLPDIAKMNAKISETVQRISSIVSGLRSFSRDGSNDCVEIAPVKHIVEDTLVFCREKLKNSGIEMNVNPIPDNFNIRCQPVQISQVLLNLINNSCDAILHLKDRWIEIATEKKDGSIQISITDSGSGIPGPILDKLFQPFFTTKEVGKGTGLGLSISKGIVESHRGQMTIDSTCKNTRFILNFPDGNVPSTNNPIKKPNAP
ncbi:MAG: response regulator [Bdellovibrionia bacterium]